MGRYNYDGGMVLISSNTSWYMYFLFEIGKPLKGSFFLLFSNLLSLILFMISDRRLLLKPQEVNSFDLNLFIVQRISWHCYRSESRTISCPHFIRVLILVN